MAFFKKSVLCLFIAAAFAACGSAGDDACDDVVCLEGTSCVIQDSGPACVPNE